MEISWEICQNLLLTTCCDNVYHCFAGKHNFSIFSVTFSHFECGLWKREENFWTQKKSLPGTKKSWSLIGNKNAGTIGLKIKRLGNGWGFYILEFWYKMLKVLRPFMKFKCIIFWYQRYYILISKVLHSDIKGITFWWRTSWWWH